MSEPDPFVRPRVPADAASSGLRTPSSNRSVPVTLRVALPEDTAGLLELTRATPMDGAIPLRTDREPEFSRLPRLRGDEKVIVATHKGRVVGSISAASAPAFVSGNVETVGYPADLKVHPSFSGSRLVLRLLQTMREDLADRGYDLLFTVVAAGNDRATSLLQGRMGTPLFCPTGRFRVHGLLPTPFQRGSGRYEIGPPEPNEIPRAVTLINDFNRSFQFAPYVTAERLQPRLEGWVPPLSRILVARSGGRIVASVSLLDTDGVKSNVLMGLPLDLKVCVAGLRALNRVVPQMRTPRIGEPLPLLYLRHLAHEPRHAEALRALVQVARHTAFQERYAFLVLGIHERDPLRAVVRGIPRLSFVSEGFAMSLRGRPEIEQIAAGIPAEDFALV